MPEIIDYLNAYYTRRDEDHRLLSRAGSVEFLTTVRYVEKYLRSGMKIMEIGAGTGCYSHFFAQKGYSVDAVELVEYNIDIFNQNTLPDEQISVTQGNAVDLSAFKSESYDITLLLGPMYHLFSEEDKLKALSEALRVTKKGGIVFAAYVLIDACFVQKGFACGRMKQFISNGQVDPETVEAKSAPEFIFEVFRKEDIDRLMEKFDVGRLHYVAADGFTEYIKDAVNEMDDELFELYLRYHFSICERPDILGASNHVIDIFRKRS